MISYNPGVNDVSGQILGRAAVGAAETTANANVGLVNDIGGALVSLAGAYAGNKAMKAEADGYDRIGEILGSSMFKDNAAVSGMLADLKSQKDPQMKIAGYNALFNLAGPMSNAMNAQRSAGIRESQPFVAADLQNRRNVAGGNTTYTPSPADVASTKPPLPAVAGAPAAAPSPTPAQSIPGGQASIDAINADRKRRGLPPI